MDLRTQTLNCISEEMYDKPSFRDAIKNGQRCLIPISGFYVHSGETDDKGTVKIPYYIHFSRRQATFYWWSLRLVEDPETGTYNYTYTVLTTRANAILNTSTITKAECPVIIDKENERAWLNQDLKKKTFSNFANRRTIQQCVLTQFQSFLTTKDINTNVPAVRQPLNYNVAVEEANRFYKPGIRNRHWRCLSVWIAQSATNEKHKNGAFGDCREG